MAQTRHLVPEGGYGWASMSAAKFAAQLEQAGEQFQEFVKTNPVDAIAFSGSSGAAIGFHIATTFHVPCIYVRKPGEQTHGSPVECNATCEIHRYLLVDDFISSGSTVKRIIKKIEEQARSARAPFPRCVGILCFSEDNHVNTIRYKGVDYPVMCPYTFTTRHNRFNTK